jgi:hypothetical protein
VNDRPARGTGRPIRRDHQSRTRRARPGERTGITGASGSALKANRPLRCEVD